MQCHVEVGKKAPLANQRCVGCHDHDEIATRIATRQGFHASALVTGVACAKCHREHKGRSYDNLGWNEVPGGRAQFDHALTGWPLPAAYVTYTCARCHTRQNGSGQRLYVGLDRAQFP
jgi:hypothetical protein